MSNSSLPRIVLVASTVGWLLGGLFVLISVAIAVPAIALGSLSFGMFLPIPLAMAYCAAGFFLRRGKRAGALTGAIASGVYVLLMFVGSGWTLTGAIVIHLLFLALSIGALRSLPTSVEGISTESEVFNVPGV